MRQGRGWLAIGFAGLALLRGQPLVAADERAEPGIAIRLEEHVITATRVRRPLAEVPGAVTAIESDQIERQSPAIITDLLRGQTGVYVQQTTPGQGTPIVRGLTGSSVLMLVDGMRLNNALFRPSPNQYYALVDPYHVDRLEVLRGAGSTLYGSDAIAGVVHVETPMPRFETETWQSRGRVLGEFASADTAGLGRVAVAAGRSGIAFAGGATYQDHDDVVSGNGVVQRRSNYNVVSADGALTLESDVQDVFLSLQYLQQPETPRYDALVAGFGQDHPESDVFVFKPNDRLFAHGRYRSHGLAPFLDELIAHVAFQEINDDRTTRDFEATREDREKNRSRLTGITLQGIADWRDRMTFTYGTDIYLDHIDSSRNGRNVNTGEVSPRPSRFPDGSDLNSFAFYVEDEIHIVPRLTLVLGGRFSYFMVDIPESGDSPKIDRDILDGTGSLGIVYRLLDGFHLVSNVSRGFRVPNVFDFAQLGSRPGNRFSVPNPDLDPETAISTDLGFKLARGQISAEILGFYLHVDDKIEPIPTGEVLPDGREVVQSENLNSVDYAGIEAGASWTPTNHLTVYGSLNYTWGEEEFTDGQRTPADRIPPVNGQLGAWWRPWPRLWFEPYVRFAGDQNRLSDRDKADPRVNPQGTDGWLTINGRVGVQLNRYLHARLTIENVIDEVYREHGSGIDAPGTNVIVALDAGW